jgi:hypothetical protein
MSDEEWERWTAAFKERGRPMPDIVKRARRDEVRARVGMVLFYALATAVFVRQLWIVGTADTGWERARAAFACGGMGLMVGGVALGMHGAGPAVTNAPLDLLAAMERRNMGRGKMILLLRWCLAYFVVGACVLLAARWWTGTWDPKETRLLLVNLTVSPAVVLTFTRRMRVRLEQHEREIAEARTRDRRSTQAVARGGGPGGVPLMRRASG